MESTLWNTTTKKSNMVPLDSRMNLPEKNLFTLNLDGLRTLLQDAPKRTANLGSSSKMVALPNGDGKMENFRVYENSNMDPALEARYPEIKSYFGVNTENSATTAYFSVSPLGFKSMVIYADRSATFIEPISQDLTTYTVL